MNSEIGSGQPNLNSAINKNTSFSKRMTLQPKEKINTSKPKEKELDIKNVNNLQDNEKDDDDDMVIHQLDEPAMLKI